MYAALISQHDEASSRRCWHDLPDTYVAVGQSPGSELNSVVQTPYVSQILLYLPMYKVRPCMGLILLVLVHAYSVIQLPPYSVYSVYSVRSSIICLYKYGNTIKGRLSNINVLIDDLVRSLGVYLISRLSISYYCGVVREDQPGLAIMTRTAKKLPGRHALFSYVVFAAARLRCSQL